MKNWIAPALVLSFATTLATAALAAGQAAGRGRSRSREAPAGSPRPEAAAKQSPRPSRSRRPPPNPRRRSRRNPPTSKEARQERQADKKEEDKPKVPWSADGWSGLTLRGIGPAVTSGRIADLAVDPTDKKRWFVAVASGGVWRTENAGTTWTPVFDGEGSYSIGCVAIDPSNPSVVWVGTGENNSQRSVGYGDGVYKTEDGGKSWKNVGLKSSEHIGKILIDPRDSNVVYVAAQGPLWSPGGDRGLYKTTDGGKTWNAVLTVSENTGVTDVVMDPRDPDVLLAAAYQRRRHVFTLIDGGPESALYKIDRRRQDLDARSRAACRRRRWAASASRSRRPTPTSSTRSSRPPPPTSGGIYRSTNRGETWEKRSDYSPQAMYYQKVFVDPKNADRVYSIDVFLKVSDDAGKTWRNLGERYKHVDNHVIWIDPDDTDHYLVGCDGGLYESFDRAATWRFFANLPITQFYRVDVDNAAPVLQRLRRHPGQQHARRPSRTLTEHGATNSDWFVTRGGDGFHARVDPERPEHRLLEAAVRRARPLRPQERRARPDPAAGRRRASRRCAGTGTAPLVISPHKHTRLYFAAQRVFRSDDRGDSWTPISGDLTRQLDRNKLKVMGKLWGPDAVAKSQSTSFYGNIVALDESPLVEGLLYVGTDDGLIQVSEDGGQSWRRQDESSPACREQSYVSDLFASRFDKDVVYAAFNNHKNGDFKPYLLRSADRGRSWTAIAGGPPRARQHLDDRRGHRRARAALRRHRVRPLLLAATAGSSGSSSRAACRRSPVRDLAIQRRENDLVVATFGRGIYILDD